MDIPAVLVSNGQWNVVAVNDLHLAQPGGLREERIRQRQKINAGFPRERPGGYR
jgi:hypothetical protein